MIVVHSCTCILRSLFKDGLASEAALVERAVELGMPGIGLTNHGHLYGAPRIHAAAEEHQGFQVVYGMEAYEAVPEVWDGDPEGPHHKLFKDKYDPAKPRYFHLTLWALDQTGWENLCALHALSFTKAYKPKNQPLIDRVALAKHSDGLVIGLGCPQSRTNRALQRESPDAAYRAAKWYVEVVGPDRVYMEVMSALADQVAQLADQRKLAKRLGIQCLGVNDVHYLTQADGVLRGPHHTLVMARKFKSAATTETESGDLSDDSYGSWYGSDQFYLKTRQEMLASGIFANEVDASIELLNRVQFNFGKMPEPAPPVARIPAAGEDPGFDSWLSSINRKE